MQVLIPPKEITRALRGEVEEPAQVLAAVKYRVEWEREQRRLREREAAELERERLAYASIDWHDFVVVQTVDFLPGEGANLPPPCTPKDVGARVLAQQRYTLSTLPLQVWCGTRGAVQGGADEAVRQCGDGDGGLGRREGEGGRGTEAGGGGRRRPPHPLQVPHRLGGFLPLSAPFTAQEWKREAGPRSTSRCRRPRCRRT